MNDKLESTGEPSENLQGPTDLLSSRQIEKLDLEIESLRRKSRKVDKYSPLFPLIGSLVTVIAVIAGFWQFQRQQESLQEKTLTEQRHARANRLQDQLRGDVDKILRFAKDETQTISMVSFLLDDISLIIDEGQKIPDEQSAKSFTDSKRTVTAALVQQIVNDADFEKRPRDIIFASKIVAKWPDYRDYLKEGANLGALRRILNNYTNALGKFRDNNPEYLNKLTYDACLKRFFPPPASDSSLLKTLNYILEGFKEHLNLMSGGQAAKEPFISVFMDALHNDSVAKTLEDEPCKKQ